MWEEYELKLALLPEDIPRLSRNSLVRSLASQRAKTKHLHSTYFDTDAQDLRRRGMALRVRHIGKRWVQTLKTPGDGQTGLQHYREYEAEVEGNQPDLSRIEDTNLQALFAEQQLAAKLQPVFTTEFDRRSVPLRLGDSEVELAVDKGEITAGDAKLPICEAELELISGPTDRIYELALALNERVPLRLEQRTKAARGYSLAAALSPEPIKSKPLQLSSEMTVAEVIAVVARNCLDQIRGNEAAVFAGVDPEGVHQFRVGVRRLRSMLTTFKDFLTPRTHGYLREELAWLQSTMGPPRDWDVFIDETLLPLRARLTGEPGLGEAIEAAQALKYQAYQQAKTALFDPRYTALMLRLQLWLDTGSWLIGAGGSAQQKRIERVGCKLLDIRARKLHKSGGSRDQLSEPELHRVRIEAKKLRYLTEFFESLYPRKAVLRHTKALRDLQDTLGALNDSVVGDELLEQLGVRLSRGLEQPKMFTREALAVVRGWQAACIERELANFDDAWTQYEAIKRYWN